MEVREWETFGQVIAGLAWAAQLPALVVLCSAHNARSPSLTSTAMVFFSAGTFIAVLDFLLNAGTTSMVAWISQEFALSHQDYRNFMITYLVASSRDLWLLATHWLFLAAGLMSIGIAVIGNSKRSSETTWGKVAMFGALLSVIMFGLELAREVSTSNWKDISTIMGLLHIGLGIFILPGLLIWVGAILPGVLGDSQYAVFKTPPPAALPSSHQPQTEL